MWDVIVLISGHNLSIYFSFLLEYIKGQGYCLTDKSSPNQWLILIKVNPHQLSITLQVNSSKQFWPIRSRIGVL